ncbi:MAG: VacB/RNase II family 3'-5' exoribonuclease [Oscillospiraceae bacterium]|nr:VacB/RNase II family 3'-5' exoribonuclease [Oscillospiraceae bacterium]
MSSKSKHKKHHPRGNAPADPKETAEFCRKIKTFLKMTHSGRMSRTELYGKCHARRSPASYEAALEQLSREGVIVRRRSAWVLAGTNAFRARTVRVPGSFGFVRDEQGTEHFVPGKYLLGSVPGDLVLAAPIPSRTGEPEAQVLRILEPAADVRITGEIVPTPDGLYLRPDGMSADLMHIDYRESVPYRPGDKVLCELTERGERHREHRVRVLMSFGSAQSAAVCMAARLEGLGIREEFPGEAEALARKCEETGITQFDLEGRLDLRGERIFTIDGAHAKDLDDAVCVQQHPDGHYTLWVHIADVSHYVRPGTALDSEALLRGTSIYYGDRVIPMLPRALSNGICSLHPDADRLTLSCRMELSADGGLCRWEFHKAVIRSCVRGVYDECNAVLSGRADAALEEKYAPVREQLFTLDALCTKLEALRARRGAPSLESTEAAVLLDENGVCVGLSPVERGRSECIIESCMLLANEAAARFAREQKFPLVYRVHETPSPERIAGLREVLGKLSLPDIPERPAPGDIRRLLEETRETPAHPVINALTLRAMAKARYSEEPLGHYGLALRDYAHFTSPIRRYPDLAVHRILSDRLDGADSAWLQKRYAAFTQSAALRSSETEVRAMQLEREADACYAAEFMRAHIGEDYTGIISGVTDHGIYVTLPNMAEGLWHIRDMPEGEYEIEEGWFLRDTLTGRTLHLGEPIAVRVAGAEVSTGRIDLVGE